jgi:putative ABC transport system permease protein
MLSDLRFALRQLAKRPGFTAVAVGTLALGIGASTSVFSVVEGTLLRSLPFPAAERLVAICTAPESYHATWRRGCHSTSPFTAYEVWRSQGAVFEDMAAHFPRQPILAGLGEPERVRAWVVTSSLFRLLGATPMLGRVFSPQDDRPGTEPIAIVSHAFWASRLGSDPNVIGRTVTLDTTTYVVVGVMSPRFRYPVGADVWLPAGTLFSGPAASRWMQDFGWWVVGRLRSRTTRDVAQQVLTDATRRGWAGEQPDTRWLPVVMPLRWSYVRDVRTPLLLMLGAVTLLLLVACANVANLLLARATTRVPEMAIRRALGAGRARLAYQCMTESLLVAIAGGVVGLLIAAWAVPHLVTQVGEELPGVSTIGINGWVLIMCVGTSMTAGLLSGLVPAIHLSRGASAEALKAVGSRGAVSRRRRSGASDASLVFQSALTLTLLAGAGLLAVSFFRLVRVDPGFDTEQIVTAELRLPETRYRDADQRSAFARATLEQVRTMPGVTSAAMASGIPIEGGGFGVVVVSGAGQSLTRGWFAGVTPEYFRTMNIPLLRGTVFDESSSHETFDFVIDEAAVREYFGGEDPLGRRITIRGGALTGIVVGVVGDTKQESLDAPPPPHVYYSLLPAPPQYLKVVARASGDAAAMAGSLRDAIWRVDAGMPIDRLATMQEILSASLARQRFYSLLLWVFAGSALALAAAAMFGAASYAVGQRTRELGLRIALGSRPAAVVSLIVGRSLRLVIAGIAFGLIGAVALTRLLRSFLFEVEPTDPWVFTGVACLLAGVVLLASWLPARRAARIDPMEALRYE